MNREIKFRFWGDKSGYDPIMRYWPNDHLILDSFLKAKDIPCMQYTGLKDKNGKEIYEGDFLLDAEDSKPMRHRIVCIDDGAKFEIETLEDDKGHWSHGIIDDLDDCDMKYFEIIGNIYENPELLK